MIVDARPLSATLSSREGNASFAGAYASVTIGVVRMYYMKKGSHTMIYAFVKDTNKKLDVILGLSHFRIYEPCFSRHHQSVPMIAAYSSYGHLITVLERCKARKYSKLSEVV